MSNNGKQIFDENFLFELRNELMGLARAIGVIREHLSKSNHRQSLNLCNIYMSRVNSLIAKVNTILSKTKRREHEKIS